MTNNSIYVVDQMPLGAVNLTREDGWKLEVEDFEEPIIGELVDSHESPQATSNKDLTSESCIVVSSGILLIASLVDPFPEPESPMPRAGEGCMEVLISSEECLSEWFI